MRNAIAAKFIIIASVITLLLSTNIASAQEIKSTVQVLSVIHI